jgi:hypothetical protein
MDSLPLEIVSDIVDILSYDSPSQLRSYAPISKSWQSAIEQRTFQSLKLNIKEIDVFHLMFNSYKIYRAQFLLKLAIEFGDRAKDEEQDRRRDETEEGSKAVSRLINILTDIAARATNTPPLTLAFTDCADYNGSGLSDMILPDLDPCLYRVEKLTTRLSHDWNNHAILRVCRKLKGLKDWQLTLYDYFEFGRRKRAELRCGMFRILFVDLCTNKHQSLEMCFANLIFGSCELSHSTSIIPALGMKGGIVAPCFPRMDRTMTLTSAYISTFRSLPV